MKEQTNENIDSGLTFFVIAAIVILLLIVGIGMCNKNKTEESLRSKNGIDTLYTDDSGYIIHFTIDSAFKK
jgi:glucose uptake protein GlcU